MEVKLPSPLRGKDIGDVVRAIAQSRDSAFYADEGDLFIGSGDEQVGIKFDGGFQADRHYTQVYLVDPCEDPVLANLLRLALYEAARPSAYPELKPNNFPY